MIGNITTIVSSTSERVDQNTDNLAVVADTVSRTAEVLRSPHVQLEIVNGVSSDTIFHSSNATQNVFTQNHYLNHSFISNATSFIF